MGGEINLATSATTSATTSPDPGRPSAQPQTTAIVALGALTEELVAARETMAHLPSREEVDLRIGQERENRKRGQRLVGAVIALLILVAGIQAWIVEETKDVASDTRHIADGHPEPGPRHQGSL